MIRIIKIILLKIGELVSLLTKNKTVNFVNIYSLFYTGYMKRAFKHWGNESVLYYKPIQLEGLKYISVGNNTLLKENIQLTAWKVSDTTTPRIVIGDNCCIRHGAHITAANEIIIGNNLLTGVNVLITDNSHGQTSIEELNIPPIKRKVFSKGKVVIGDNVWLGNNVCVMPGVCIGDGVVVGANTVVTKDIPNYAVAVGNPMRIIFKNS